MTDIARLQRTNIRRRQLCPSAFRRQRYYPYFIKDCEKSAEGIAAQAARNSFSRFASSSVPPYCTSGNADAVRTDSRYQSSQCRTRCKSLRTRHNVATDALATSSTVDMVAWFFGGVLLSTRMIPFALFVDRLSSLRFWILRITNPLSHRPDRERRS